MQQFKESVLEEDGLSVRAMSDESAKEQADQAATGLLDLVSTTFFLFSCLYHGRCRED